MRTRKIPFVAIVVALVVLGVACSVFTSFNDHTYTAIVTNKERIVTVDNGKTYSYYLVFCKDEDGNYYELKNEDNILRLKFRSSTLYNQLEIGKTYKFTVVGFRVALFSWYENIIKFEKIKWCFLTKKEFISFPLRGFLFLYSIWFQLFIISSLFQINHIIF